MRKSLILTSVLIGVFVLHFGGTAEAASWSGNVRITSLEVSNVNAAGVWLTFSSALSHNCSAKNGQFRLGGGEANINQMTSIATAALINSRNVTVFWSGCDQGGTNGYPVLIGVTLK